MDLLKDLRLVVHSSTTPPVAAVPIAKDAAGNRIEIVGKHFGTTIGDMICDSVRVRVISGHPMPALNYISGHDKAHRAQSDKCYVRHANILQNEG